MKLNIELTWSKIMALLVLGSCVFLDVYLKTDGKMTMYGLPFVTAMIGLKQVIKGKE
jgi:hypothetical protein